MKIPGASPSIGAEEEAAVLRVLRSGMLAQGPEVAAFEEEFSGLVDGRTCVALNSGTSALHLGMTAAGIGVGDEVIVPSFSFAASANAVALTGATPVFVDISLADYCIDPEAVQAAITPETAAIMAVHLYGHPAPMRPLERLARQHGLLLIEDAAQAHGARLGTAAVGALGDLAAFSFYPTKNMTTGEGGMVVSADEVVLDRVRLLRNQGMKERYRNEIVGYNVRMTDIGAAIGRVQLRHLNEWNDTRVAHANQYDSGLSGVVAPTVAADASHVYHQYTIRASNRDQLASLLQARGIGAAVYYPVPIHRLPAYDLAIELPATDIAVQEVLSLPVHPRLSSAQIETVISTVNDLTGAEASPAQNGHIS